MFFPPHERGFVIFTVGPTGHKIIYIQDKQLNHIRKLDGEHREKSYSSGDRPALPEQKYQNYTSYSVDTSPNNVPQKIKQ